MKAIMFPGQGAQAKGMGAGLFERYPAITREASEILGYAVDELCLRDPQNQLSSTMYTQPALYVVNALCYFAARDDGLERPEYLLGHSLGEYNALLVAGAFDFAAGLRLVKKRGEIMSQAKDGGLLAVLKTDASQLRQAVAEHGLESLDFANYNTPTQTILAGPKADLARLAQILAERSIQSVPLRVGGAFHSRYMAPAAREFAAHLASFAFAPLQIPVIANATGRPYPAGGTPALLAEQLCAPVRWVDSVRYLMSRGQVEYVEMGAKKVLTRMVNEIQQSAPPPETPAGDPPEQAACLSRVASDGPSAAGAPCEPARAPAAPAGSTPGGDGGLAPSDLGNPAFCREYGLKYAYLTGSMYRGISSVDMLIRLGRAGLMGYLGAGGLSLAQIEASIEAIRRALGGQRPFGLNLLCNLADPQAETATVELYLRHQIRFVEASAFMSITPALVLYRLAGLRRDQSGAIRCDNRILAKVSSPEVARAFLEPAPRRIVEKLLSDGRITADQAEMAHDVAMSSELCIEADSGGHTSMGMPAVLFPAMVRLRDEIVAERRYPGRVYLGLAGGIGTPAAAAAAFLLGADFVMTGSINQCTVESGTSATVKELLQAMEVQDTEYAPAGDMLEIGARIQVLKRGSFFAARANKLHALYQQWESVDEIPEKTRRHLEHHYFKRPLAEVWDETRQYLLRTGKGTALERADKSPKHKMALVFRWYFAYTSRLAFEGNPQSKVDYQVHTGPSMGAFNQWVKGTALEPWTNRHVDQIAERLMEGTAEFLDQRLRALARRAPDRAASSV